MILWSGRDEIFMEQERAYRMFDERFAQHKEVPMALYGLGINTKYLLEKAKDYNIVGIIANERIGEYIYGKEVIPIKAVEDKVKIIVIVAQVKSIKIIYNRIKYVEDKGIAIYDIFGMRVKDYLDDENDKMRDEPYWESTFDTLKAEIDKHDIISFDVFDTLIMRKALMPDHMCDSPEEALKGKSKEDAFKAEKKYAVKRLCVAAVVEYARLQGKEIYILSDTYLSSEQIHELLLQCSIKDIDINHVIVSSDTGTTKKDGSLYALFNTLAGKGLKLHIGSSLKADIEMAEKFGIDTYYVMSPYDMLLKSSVSEVIANAGSMIDFIVLGIFSAKAFNNPFALSESKGKLKIENMYDLGYYCFAPVTLKFLTWIADRIGNDNNAAVLFSSRDGYLLFELYKYLQNKNPQLKLPKGIYFYISRRAITVACIQTKDDIIDIVESALRFTVGNLGEILEQRLGMPFDKGDCILNRSLMDVAVEKDRKQIVDRVLEYEDEILRNAASERKNYLEYIQKNNLHTYGKVYLFDLYTRGTSLHKLNSLLGIEAELMCYAVKDFPNEYISAMDNINSMFDSTDIISGEWFRRCYQLFEAVYSSPEGQLKCFDNNGTPQFIENSEYNYSYLKEAQAGIVDFMNDLEILDEKWYLQNISLALTDSMIRIMTRKQSVSCEDLHKGFTYYDSFAAETVTEMWNRII